ncbi:MAG TPA: type IV secretion system protein [Bacillota bacterium]|nr:type IV secretion system protein [Bacillota bacterium]
MRLLLAAAPSPSPSPSPAVPAAQPGCGWFDVGCQVQHAISGWFASLAAGAVNGLLRFTGQVLLSSPVAADLPSVHGMWAGSLAIADTCFVLFVLAGGVIVMTHETLWTSYSAKEILPRLVLGFLAANLSLPLIAEATSLANGLSGALSGQGVTPGSAANGLENTLSAAEAGGGQGGGVFVILLVLTAAVLIVVLAFVYIIRLMALVLLTAAAPLALACYALPQTAFVARWWWRALTACLVIQVAQALVLTAGVRVFFSAGWLPLSGQGGGTVPVLLTICLLYIMMRIPFWVSRPVLTPFGSSPIRKGLKFAFYAAVLSRVQPLLAAGAAAGGGSGGGRGGPARRPPNGGSRPGGGSGGGGGGGSRPRRPPPGGRHTGSPSPSQASSPAAGGGSQPSGGRPRPPQPPPGGPRRPPGGAPRPRPARPRPAAPTPRTAPPRPAPRPPRPAPGRPPPRAATGAATSRAIPARRPPVQQRPPLRPATPPPRGLATRRAGGNRL